MKLLLNNISAWSVVPEHLGISLKQLNQLMSFHNKYPKKLTGINFHRYQFFLGNSHMPIVTLSSVNKIIDTKTI